MVDPGSEHFLSMNERSASAKEKRFFQDGCPIQSSIAAKRFYDRIRDLAFCLHPRSHDLNPIENVLHFVIIEIQKEAIKRNIIEETFK